MQGETLITPYGYSRVKFQPTPLIQGETKRALKSVLRQQHFNPLPLCKGRRGYIHLPLRYSQYFNPLPLCKGRLPAACLLPVRMIFQPTPLMQGETVGDSNFFNSTAISTHSPYARGDSNFR